MSEGALAVRPMSAPMVPFGLCVDIVALTRVIAALDHGHGGDRDADAAIYEALGWRVVRRAPNFRRRFAWRRRSPLASHWEALPHPTEDERDAASLVPHQWDYGLGVRDAKPFGWCRERRVRRGREVPVYFEAARLSPARSLTVAVLHGHLFLATGGNYVG